MRDSEQTNLNPTANSVIYTEWDIPFFLITVPEIVIYCMLFEFLTGVHDETIQI